MKMGVGSRDLSLRVIGHPMKKKKTKGGKVGEKSGG